MDSNSDKTNRIFSSLYNPLMTTVRILEDYLINYTSNYVIATNYTINENSNDWSEYFKTRNFYNTFFHFNVLSNLFVNYTYYSGLSYNDIWFDPDVKQIFH